jgi:hypothetical protein
MTTAARPAGRGPAGVLALLALAAVAGCATASQARTAAPAAPSTADGPAAAAQPAALRELTTGPIMRASPPVRVSIPKFHVSSRLIALGLQRDGSMAVPPDADSVGWFTGAPAPGSLGPAVLAGHEDWNGKQGAFARIGQLTTGDEIYVYRLDGSVAVFVVTRVGQYPKNQFPTDAVYGPLDHAGLRLITCGGPYDSRSHHYLDNVIAFANLNKTVAPA